MCLPTVRSAGGGCMILEGGGVKGASNMPTSGLDEAPWVGVIETRIKFYLTCILKYFNRLTHFYDLLFSY